jgi:hypothetical protein
LEDQPVILHILFYCVTFCPRDPTDSDLLVSVVVFIVAVALILFLCTFQAVYFSHNRKFATPSLYPTRIVLELVAHVILAPIAVTAGTALVEIGNGDCPFVIYIFAVLTPLLYIFAAVVYDISADFLNTSAYLSRNPFSSFVPNRHSLLFILQSILGFLHVFFQLFPRWTNLFLIVVHCGWCCYNFWAFSDLTFIRLSSSVIVMSFLATEVLTDLLSLILYVTDLAIDPVIILGIALGVLVLSLFVVAFWTKRRVAQVKIDLAYNGVVNVFDSEEEVQVTISDAEKQERFDTLSLRKAARIRTYSVIGLACSCDLFIDFTLLGHCVQYCDSPELTAFLLRIAVFFPAEYRQANLVLRRLRRFRGLSNSCYFLMHQIDRIRVVRQSSASSLAIARLKEMRAMVAEIEAITQGAWTQEHLYYPSLRLLSNAVSSGYARCQETVSDFPNSIQHADEYVHFLIECATDFVGAIRERHRIDQMEAGTSFAVDYCFKRMIGVYPHWLKKGILTYKGVLVRRTKGGAKPASSTQSSNRSHASTQGTAGSAELDVAVEHKLSRNLITQPATRLAVQAAFADKTANTMKALVIYNAYQVLLSLIVSFAADFDNAPEVLARGSSINGFRLGLSSGALSLLLHYSLVVGIDMSATETYADDEPVELRYLRFDRDYYEQATEFMLDARDEYNNYGVFMSNLALEHTGELGGPG